uniref:FtsX-like permease family protein n=1 Tax=Candidatus Kentrum sp. FM TaxID=2126340 RepID=A0A450VSQ6_9GAMM|nr:MAG: FtsX-like permease family protein [Candidatus Kentron sp. FM]VFJ52349.1 MAG: FtsX-like permease family protein [Candidatus Kentron sp. FM]VFK07726.1 MAG: FtsX-like permease family protein [Candidatus Kentron sp. FM]
MGILLSRRRRAFGILLAQGLSRGSIYSIPILQVAFCFIGAFIFAEIAVWGLSAMLNWGFDGMMKAEGYRDTLVMGGIDLLPVSWWGHVTLFFGGLGLLIALVAWRVWKMPLGKRFEPAVMITG